ncbi:hypothetical protein [Nocardioides sp. CFH 31398]|uniref:hypothetical protein n=1 Tax=Nocardioides sp. CFH 31398 TaxID=2919579 RepID=UPI001F0645A9|nr:hypothetical protein [Nocardioides sp. CFH 31398]MCH1869055.1 hypothetical protein [Nocardioides sp. CFH 31398]
MTLRHLAAAVLAATAVLAVAAPASADTETVTDPRGDTVDPGLGLNPPPAKRADILRTVGQHEDRRVTLRVTVADLGPGATSLLGRVRTDETTYTYVVNRSGGSTEAFVSQDDVGDVGCTDFTVQFQPRRDTVVMSAPRTCLSLPTWVQFGVRVTASEDEVSRTDDARRDGNGTQPVRIGQRRLFHN